MDTQSPITPKVLFEHVAGLRAEVERLREISVAQVKAEQELIQAAMHLRRAATTLTDELEQIKKWRDSVEARLPTIPPEENGSYAE